MVMMMVIMVVVMRMMVMVVMVVVVVMMSNTHKILQRHVTTAKYESSHSLAMSGAGRLV